MILLIYAVVERRWTMYPVLREISMPGCHQLIENDGDVVLEVRDILGLGPNEVRTDCLMRLILVVCELRQIDAIWRHST
jgi:hypothetical protein